MMVTAQVLFSMAWLLPLVVLSILLVVLLHVILKSSKTETTTSKFPPSPPKLPVIGNLHQLGKLQHQSLCQLSQKYGPVMLLRLGNIPTLIISSAEMAKEVMKIHDVNFCSRPDSPGARKIFYNSSDVAFSPYGNQWRERRKIFVSHLLNSKRSQSFWNAREVEINRLIESLSVASLYPVNIDEIMIDLVGRIITSIAFGKSYGENQFKGRQELKEVLDEAMDMLHIFSAQDFFPSFGWIIDYLSGHRGRLNNCFAKLDGYLQMVLDDHLGRGRPMGDEEDLVDILIGLSIGETGFCLTKEHIKAILMNMFLGGIDTSAVTMVWAMTELIKNPSVMKKVQADIRTCVAGKPKVDADDLANIKYLKMVLKETLRLHPAAPLLVPRESVNHCKLGGVDNAYDIPPKTRVLINAWAIGRDTNNWKNPNIFDPERFEGNAIDFKGAHFELIPFGAGRRICPGISASVVTMELTLANLLCVFDWELPRGMKVEDVSLEEEGGVVIHKKTPLLLVPILCKRP